MRLVRDEEPMDVDQVEQTPTVRRARGRKPIKPVMVELPDGAVDATDPEPVATVEEAAAPAVDPQADDAGDAPAAESVAEEHAEVAAEDALPLVKLEALLFATHHPLTAGRLAELLDLDSTKPIRGAIRSLNKSYTETGRAFRIEQVAGGYQMLTLPEHADLLKQMHQKEIDAKLGKAAMETLAIIAYKQPILRAEIEAIRGVACGETIRNLMEKHLVKIAGRAEEPGRPILYGTTKRFLEVFGLNSIKDLPQPEGGAIAADAGRATPRTAEAQPAGEVSASVEATATAQEELKLAAAVVGESAGSELEPEPQA